MLENKPATVSDATTPSALEPAATARSVGPVATTESFAGAHFWARAGYWIIPSLAGSLVAVPIAAAGWTMVLSHQPLGAQHAWYLICLIPAALLILASWVRFEKPEGVPITATDAPDLFLLIEQLRAYLGAPAFSTVYLTDTFTAHCIQRPSRGLLGGFRNEIVIGLPLLQSVSKAEAAVLIAHELAYLSGRQGTAVTEIHRARVTWQQILERQPKQPILLRLPFAMATGYYARCFLALSAKAERSAVLAADRLAAEIAGLSNAGSALQRLSIAEAFLEQYWLRIADEPVTTPEPTLKPHREMADFLPRMTEWENAINVLEAALAKSTSPDPSHPTLAERLDALGITPELPAPVTQPAAQLLEPSLSRVLDRFDAAWHAVAAPAWQSAYAKLSPDTRRLLDLDALAAVHPLELAPAIERARLAYFAGGLAAARGRYADLIEWFPEDARAALAAGLAMIDGGDPDGAECLRQALELAPKTDWIKVNAEDWFAVGEALLAARQDLGIDCLEQAIRIDPTRTDMAAYLVDRYFDEATGTANAA